MKSHNSTNKSGEIIILTPPVLWDPQPHFSFWSLPGPQVQVGFLGVLSSPRPMLCHRHHRHHQEHTQGGKCVGETWSTGVSAGQLGDLQATHPGLTGQLLDGVLTPTVP